MKSSAPKITGIFRRALLSAQYPRRLLQTSNSPRVYAKLGNRVEDAYEAIFRVTGALREIRRRSNCGSDSRFHRSGAAECQSAGFLLEFRGVGGKRRWWPIL